MTDTQVADGSPASGYAPPQLILASTSPRRRELLQQAGIGFLLVRPGEDGVDESVQPGEAARPYVERLARAKALAGWREARAQGHPDLPVLGADTTVVVDGQILGKPADAREARAMLALLSGRAHEVMTAICLTDGTRELAATSISQVHMQALDAPTIAAYLASGEPWDKAGGYGIQGRAACFIHHLAGSHSGVMGLPLHELHRLLCAWHSDQPPLRDGRSPHRGSAP